MRRALDIITCAVAVVFIALIIALIANAPANSRASRFDPGLEEAFRATHRIEVGRPQGAVEGREFDVWLYDENGLPLAVLYFGETGTRRVIVKDGDQWLDLVITPENSP